MQLASVRIITDDLDRSVAFYEQVTGVRAQRLAPVFAELVVGGCTLAIGHSETVQIFAAGSARASANRSVIIEFLVDDVDAAHDRLQPIVTDWVQPPTTMPWGNRSMLFRDPDGTLVNLFAPVADDAASRFDSRP